MRINYVHACTPFVLLTCMFASADWFLQWKWDWFGKSLIPKLVKLFIIVQVFVSLLKMTYFLKFGCSFWFKTNSVKENCRRLGHGEALLKAAIQKCRTRNVHRITLHVDPLRTPAMNLYKKYGFQVDNLIEGYYSSDRNAYRMYLDFDAD